MTNRPFSSTGSSAWSLVQKRKLETGKIKDVASGTTKNIPANIIIDKITWLTNESYLLKKK